jgi:DDE superfamily endonuclease
MGSFLPTKDHHSQGFTNTRHYQEVKNDFLDYFKFKVNLLNVSNDDIFNADQTNLPFSLESTYTWAKKNSQKVVVLSVCSNQRATVMLGCNASGTVKLPPFLVFKGSCASTGWIYTGRKHLWTFLSNFW